MSTLGEARQAAHYTSSIEHISLRDLHARHAPDVPEDVDHLMEHLNDPNYDLSQLRQRSFSLGGKKDAYDASEIESHLESDLYSMSRVESRNSTAVDFDDESPYPEVRASVSSVDDPLMPVNTFRVWFLGIVICLVTSGLNQLLSARNPGIFIAANFALLLSFPLGHGLAKILPTKRFKTFGHVWSFNPGPFNIKEHTCITVMASISCYGAYSTEVALTQRLFYSQAAPISYQILLAVSSQTVGFSFSGLLRPLIVWPSSMIWPGVLVNVTLLNTLHKDSGKTDRHISRQRFFAIAMVCSFVWYWIPGYFFTALSMFNWVCWIAPNNVPVNTLFGTMSGLGMGIISFDWTMISFIGNPLVMPWWAQMNIGIAFVVLFWIVTPILYFTNSYDFAYFPISSTRTFDNTGMPYLPKNIITGAMFDQAKYSAYSPVFLTTTQALAYGVSFAILPATLVHTFLWFRKDIVRRFHVRNNEPDVHSRLMQAYREVPMWWYAAIGLVCFSLFCVSIEMVPTRLPIWAAVFGVILAFITAVPLAMLQAITNQQVSLQVMNEFVAGYIIPGKPIANIIFKTISLIPGSQATSFAYNLKLGHYMKIPPRMMFSIQVVSTVIAAIWVTIVQEWMFTNIEDMCSPHQKQGFVCPGSTAFAASSVVWGAVGPSRLFSIGQKYSNLLWFFPLGAIAPIPFYFLARRFPLSFWRYVNIPICLAGLTSIPIGTGVNYILWVIFGFIFNYWVRRFRFRWWLRYNYILSAGLDGGTIIGIFVVFFTLQAWKTGGVSIEWWGNTVWTNTADFNGVPFKPLPPSGIVGPSTWS